ncbi:MAG: DUF4124 domain-containing protein [Pseudomonadales bacterium]|nr:DUF4124 domain-containing protein [Pseudomonadales bacterium]
MTKLPFFLFFIFISPLLAADIYQWRDGKGQMHYSDQPNAKAKVLLIDPGIPSIEEKIQHQQVQKEISITVKNQSADRRQHEKTVRTQQLKIERAQSKKQASCDKTKERLVQEQIRWKYQRRKGYKEQQKVRHKEKIEQLKSQVEKVCGG